MDCRQENRARSRKLGGESRLGPAHSMVLGVKGGARGTSCSSPCV